MENNEIINTNEEVMNDTVENAAESSGLDSLLTGVGGAFGLAAIYGLVKVCKWGYGKFKQHKAKKAEKKAAETADHNEFEPDDEEETDK